VGGCRRKVLLVKSNQALIEAQQCGVLVGEIWIQSYPSIKPQFQPIKKTTLKVK